MNEYMYEILEDYQFAKTTAEQEEIFASFCRLIWGNHNQRTIVSKPVKFQIKPELLSAKTAQIFSAYTCIPRTVCLSHTCDKDFASLIRQKLNNLYTRYFDGTICRKKDYLTAIRLPKKLYFQWLSAVKKGDGSWNISDNELSRMLEDAMAQAKLIKETSEREAMRLTWEEFQQAAEGYLHKLFDNYQPLDDFQDSQNLMVYAGDWNEDNFCVSYFCRGLDGYFRNYQKKYYGLYNVNSRRGVTYGRCACGSLFFQNKQHNRKLCDNCRKYARRQSYSRYNQKRA